jgi:hypothetical protein
MIKYILLFVKPDFKTTNNDIISNAIISKNSD